MFGFRLPASQHQRFAEFACSKVSSGDEGLRKGNVTTRRQMFSSVSSTFVVTFVFRTNDERAKKVNAILHGSFDVSAPIKSSDSYRFIVPFI